MDNVEDMLIFALVFGIAIVLIILMNNFMFHGVPRETLLGFTCEELLIGDISTDGPDGRFVVDKFILSNYIHGDIINDALIEKGCIGKDYKFYYKNIQKGD